MFWDCFCFKIYLFIFWKPNHFFLSLKRLKFKDRCHESELCDTPASICIPPPHVQWKQCQPRGSQNVEGAGYCWQKQTFVYVCEPLLRSGGWHTHEPQPPRSLGHLPPEIFGMEENFSWLQLVDWGWHEGKAVWMEWQEGGRSRSVLSEAEALENLRLWRM